MFGLTPRPVVPDTFWLLYQADLVVEWHFLALLALLVLMWRHRRPRESQLLLLAIACHGLSYLPPLLVNVMLGASWSPLRGLGNALFSIRPYLQTLSSVFAALLQALVWWCLVQAAFGDTPPPPELSDETRGKIP